MITAVKKEQEDGIHPQCNHCMSRDAVFEIRIDMGGSMRQCLLLCRSCVALLNRVTYNVL